MEETRHDQTHGRKTLESFETKPHFKPQDRRDTAVMVSITSQDRRPPHGTQIAQAILHPEEGYKVRAGNIGPCPHCRRQLNLRVIMERID